MLGNALLFLLKTVLDLLTLAFLLRFYFQLTRVSFQSQAAQIIVTLTNFAVKPMRRVMVVLRNLGFSKLDVSTLLLAYITQLLLTLGTLWLSGHALRTTTSSTWLTILSIALIGVAILSISIFLYAVLIQAVLSWVNPHTPIAPILNNLTHPILHFLRKFIPLVGNVDLSPLAFIIAGQLLLATILIPLENNLLSTL
ncbi:MAG: YggT family protein [Methylotenera sp.]|nr:YggT family protein [Methylotenera sp.]NOT65203.1 YggT family protein [Methylotenera sp.]